MRVNSVVMKGGKVTDNSDWPETNRPYLRWHRCRREGREERPPLQRGTSRASEREMFSTGRQEVTQRKKEPSSRCARAAARQNVVRMRRDVESTLVYQKTGCGIIMGSAQDERRLTCGYSTAHIFHFKRQNKQMGRGGGEKTGLIRAWLMRMGVCARSVLW